MISLLLAVLALATPLLAIPTISVKGSKFFTEDGAQFYIKGVAYQLDVGDPLVDTAQCQRDASLMQTLGANSIRVYHVVASSNHDGCMQAFSDAGIYAWIDLDTYDTYILPGGQPPRWTQRQYSAYQQVMDTFHVYDNVAGFFVGNEMLTIGNNSVAAPFIKAAARDMKAYRDKKGYRPIPVGYSAADIPSLRPNLQNYLACGGNSADNVDFYSLNAYEWCGDSSYSVSGYSELQKNASDYDIPIFFSETGCNTPEPRLFQDQSAIFGPEMSGTWSGAIIYEWIEEANNYGLISYGPEVAATASGAVGGFTRSGSPTPISPDFENLSSQWATLSPTGVSENAYSPTLTPPACPSFTSGMWELSGNVALPTVGAMGTTYTKPAPTATSTAGSGSTSSSSAAAPTKALPRPISSTLTSRRTMATEPASKILRKIQQFRENWPGAWWVIISVITCAGLGFTV